MTNHPNRSRADFTQIDFSAPCAPSIHEMPADVQKAGRKIRQEIQRRYGRATSLSRTASGYGRSGNPAALAIGDRLHAQADAAWADHKRLDEAYHAWSMTATRIGGAYEADPSLLRRVALDDKTRSQLGECIENDRK